MKTLIISVLLICTLISCKEKEDEITCEEAKSAFYIPQEKLDEINGEDNFAQTVVGFLEDGQIFYHVIDRCCDLYVYNYNENWEYVCSTGGFAGEGDGKCKSGGEINCETILWERLE